MHKRKGYSLIEIIAVMAIMGILLAIGYNSFATSRMRARDTRRKSDLQVVKLATVTFKQDNGKYPNSNTTGLAYGAACSSLPAGVNLNANWNSLATQLKPYLSTMPLDPSNSDCTGAAPWYSNAKHVYQFADLNQTQYAIWTALENPNDPDRNNSTSGTDATGGKYSNLTYYETFTPANQALYKWDNVNNLYGVGCRVVAPKCYDN